MQEVIATSADAAQSVFATDLDGDGDADVLSAPFDDKVAWYENPAAALRRGKVITTAAGAPSPCTPRTWTGTATLTSSRLPR